MSIAQHQRSSGSLWLGEAVATAGLVLVIFGTVRAGRTRHLQYAAGGYITAAYWFTSSNQLRQPGRHNRPYPVQTRKRSHELPAEPLV